MPFVLLSLTSCSRSGGSFGRTCSADKFLGKSLGEGAVLVLVAVGVVAWERAGASLALPGNKLADTLEHKWTRTDWGRAAGAAVEGAQTAGAPREGPGRSAAGGPSVQGPGYTAKDKAALWRMIEVLISIRCMSRKVLDLRSVLTTSSVAKYYGSKCDK